ncbi:hypothetical protein CWI36_1858p0030, partial [Hamiltosporidium magnivora]
AECTDKTRCTSKKQTEQNNELNTAEVLRTVQAVKPRVRGRDLDSLVKQQKLNNMSKKKYHHHPKNDSSSFLSDHTNNTQDNIFKNEEQGKMFYPLNKDTSSTKDHNANVINEMIDASDNKNTNSDTTTLYETTQITHNQHTLTSNSNKTTHKPRSLNHIQKIEKPYRKRSLETTNSEIGEDQVKKINYQADIKETISDKSEVAISVRNNILKKKEYMKQKSSPIKLTAEQLALLTQGKSPFTNARHNIQPGASKLVVNMEFLSNTVLEVICKGSVQIEVIRGFRMLGAKNFINSPEVDSNGLFKISNLFTRMKKIKDRQGNKNDKLRSLAVRILKSKGIKLTR